MRNENTLLAKEVSRAGIFAQVHFVTGLPPPRNTNHFTGSCSRLGWGSGIHHPQRQWGWHLMGCDSPSMFTFRIIYDYASCAYVLWLKMNTLWALKTTVPKQRPGLMSLGLHRTLIKYSKWRVFTAPVMARHLHNLSFYDWTMFSYRMNSRTRGWKRYYMKFCMELLCAYTLNHSLLHRDKSCLFYRCSHLIFRIC